MVVSALINFDIKRFIRNVVSGLALLNSVSIFLCCYNWSSLENLFEMYDSICWCRMCKYSVFYKLEVTSTPTIVDIPYPSIVPDETGSWYSK